MLLADVRIEPLPSPIPARDPAPDEAAVTEQPADIPIEPRGLSSARGLTFAIVALLVAAIVTVLILRRRRR